MNHARDRMENDFAPIVPKDDIQCKTCKFKRSGVIGYKIAYCEKYNDGKPDEILFEGAECEFYEEE